MGLPETMILLGAVGALLAAKGLHAMARRFPPEKLPPGQSLLPLWIAQGFGAGQSPKAPGTAGSVVGIAWFLLLLLPGNWVAFLAGILFSIPASVYFCGKAEQLMNQRDPGAVVLDEIIAIPLSFVAWVGLIQYQTGAFPAWDYFFSARTWPLTLAIFAGFRFFDILKPWPVRQSQELPGGWGVTMDDVLAAGYVNLATLAVNAGHQWWAQRAGQ